MDENDPLTEPAAARELQERLGRGAEPFWMQDVRIAQRRIEAQRISLRPARSSGESTEF